MSSFNTSFYPEATFGGFTEIDGTIAFYARVNALIRPDFVILDFGCGRGSYSEDTVPFRRNLRCFKGKVSRVIGMDVDSVGENNPFLDEFRMLIPGREWPLDAHSANLILCDFVIEHLPDPSAFFREARRVLVRGGYVCVRTPNAHSYVGIISRIVPNKYHKKATAVAQSGRKQEDVFPTLYRCNTISLLRREMKQNGFRYVVHGYEAEPSYLEFSKLAYAIGVIHQRFALNFMRPAIFAFGQLTA